MRRKHKAKPKTGLSVLQEVAEATASVVATEQGKLLMTYLCEKVNSRSTYVPGDPHATHLKEGMRVLYLHIRYLAELGKTGEVTPVAVAEEQPIWQQTRDITTEEISGGDFVESGQQQ